ncbi:MAG: glycosyltransferase family 2 protein [Deltaproteobacteria bacterium]
MIDLSILLPTRGRPDRLKALFESLISTTAKVRALEVVLYLDENDAQSRAVVCPELNITRVIRPHGAPMGAMVRECFEASSGRLVMLMNDDAAIRTNGWDAAMLQAFEGFPDGVALVYGNDLDQGARVPTFPAMPRFACGIIGGPCPPDYLNLHIESHIFDIFNRLKALGHDRIRYLDDVVFEHMHYTVGKSGVDATYVKKDPGHDDMLFIGYAEERRHAALSLARHIAATGERGAAWRSQINKPDVSLIVTGNGGFVHPGRTMSEAALEASFEVIAEPHRADELRDMCGDKAGVIRAREGAEGRGHAEACALSAESAHSDYLVFITNRIDPRRGWLRALLGALKADERAGIAGCKFIDPRNGRIRHAGYGFYRERDSLRLTSIYMGTSALNPAVNKLRELQAVSAGCMMVRRDVFLNCAAPKTGEGCIDVVGLSVNARLAGFKTLYVPDGVVELHGDDGPCRCGQTGDFPDALIADLTTVLEEDGYELMGRTIRQMTLRRGVEVDKAIGM